MTLLPSALVFAAVFSLGYANRAFCYKNSCNSTIRVDYVGGATNYTCNGSGQAGCPTGTTCVSPPGLCFFTLPEINPGLPFFLLQESEYICVPFEISCLATNNGKFTFSGAIYASTGCNETGYDCATGTIGPATRAEMTLGCESEDFYDISIINGVNVGISMRPLNQSAPCPSDINPNYYCLAPGAPESQGNNPGCSWNFSPPNEKYQLVSGGTGIACTSSSDCSAPEVCGTAMVTVGNDLPTPNVVQVCGILSGYWTDDELCSWTAAISYGNCTQGVPGSIGVFRDLLGCAGPYSGSCYTPGAGPNCCGCSNWENLGVHPPTLCNNTNAAWVEYVLPVLTFLKEACPTAYTFPYDDETSTFQCSTDLNNNQMSYEIEFCPEQAAKR